MYSFIFGFQRFVWWPKCTPASSSSFIAIAAKLILLRSSRLSALGYQLIAEGCELKAALTFAELEAFARPSHPVFLALLGARVARQETFTLQRLAQLQVVLDERARDPQPHCAGLSGHAAAGDRGKDVELVCRLGEHQRRL